MWPVIAAVMRTYAPVIFWPLAFTAGVIGYNLEKFIGSKQLPDQKSTLEVRNERLLSESIGEDRTKMDSLKSKLSGSFFEKNNANK